VAKNFQNMLCSPDSVPNSEVGYMLMARLNPILELAKRNTCRIACQNEYALKSASFITVNKACTFQPFQDKAYLRLTSFFVLTFTV
jgi:hypothetical protein